MEDKNYEQEGLNFGPWIFISQSNVRLSKIDKKSSLTNGKNR